MVELRTALGASGLPALFVLREGMQTLELLLERYGAPGIGIVEAQTDALVASLNLLLQGNR
jgi:hypothetical protein